MTGDLEARRRVQDPVAALPYDIGSQLASVLRDACELETPELFFDYAAHAQTGLHFREHEPKAICGAIEWMRAHPGVYVPTRNIDTAQTVLSKTHSALREVRTYDSSFIDESSLAGSVARRFLDSVLEGQESAAMREILVAIARGVRIVDVYERILVPVLHEVGRLWIRNEIGVAQEHAVTGAVERAMGHLFDLTTPSPHRDLSVVTATLGRSAHQIGARMVSDAFAFCGWDATYLGGNLPEEDLIDYIDHASIDVLALSATLPTDIMPVKRLIAELEERPLAPLVLVGGRAFSVHPTLWKKIGADGYARTPLTGVTIAGELISHSECN